MSEAIAVGTRTLDEHPTFQLLEDNIVSTSSRKPLIDWNSGSSVSSLGSSESRKGAYADAFPVFSFNGFDKTEGNAKKRALSDTIGWHIEG